MNYKHGKVGSRTYSIWMKMLDRCRNKNGAAYADYGGRGINVCRRWHKFENFLADMGECPEGLSIDRIYNAGNYEPGNCRWATRTEQNRNKRTNVLVTIGGETHALSVWVERYGLKYRTVHQRINAYGWTPEQALTTPLVTKRKGIPRGQRIAEFGARHGVVFQDNQESAA